MYVGRIVCIAKTADGRLCALYRVSSRSFPNRTSLIAQDRVSIVPKPGFETDVQKSPYIVYNCVRLVCDGGVAVVSNGSHTDPIAEKIAMGMPVRDAITLTLHALDYEKDHYNTPRICAVADKRGEGAAWLGIVRDNGIEVRRTYVEPGHFWHVATYEDVHLCIQPSGDFTAITPYEACDFILSESIFAERTHAITAVAAVATDEGFALSAKDAPLE